MQRTITALLAALALSCGAPAQAQQASGEISFMIFGDPAEKAAYEGLVAAFDKLKLIGQKPERSEIPRLAAELLISVKASRNKAKR